MSFYFTLASIPELADLPASERRIAWHNCRNRAYRRWQTWVGTALAGLAGVTFGAGTLFAFVYLSPFSRLPTYFVAGFVCGAVVVGVTEWLRTVVVASQIRPYLREYVEDPDEEQAGRIDIDYLRAPFESDATTPETELNQKK